MESWSWEELSNNSFNGTLNETYTINNNNICDDITNHWLYFIFSGYLLPLISPKVRDWLKETLNSLKNSSVGGKFVTLTEFGFNKIQDIEDNEEMKDYIKRLCKEKNPHLFYSEESLEKLALLFSGDEKKDGLAQSWNKLNKIINIGTFGIKSVRP